MEKTFSEPIVAFLLMMFGLHYRYWLHIDYYAIVKAELFPTEIRALGVGLPYALTVAIFGGTAEFIALWLKSIGMVSHYSTST